jgi:cardiolipin synthase
MASFAEDWWFTRAEELAGELWFSAPEACGPSAARGIDSGPDEDLGTVETILAAAIGQARTAIRVVTPYFLPSARLMSALALAALRGVRVDIVMPERSDHLALDWAVRAHLGFLDPPGVAVHLVPLPFDHAKLATVDGGWCLIGSPNWDTRSLRLNFEFALECYDPALVATLDHLIDQRIAGARRLAPGELASRPIAWKLRDAAARLMLPYL